MSNLYLIRHGQAGTRHAYDALSPLGRRQARLLGEYFVSREIRFAAAYAGGMSRQQETAREVAEAYAAAGAGFPGIVTERGWDEFDLNGVFTAIGPLLAAADPEFRREYELLLAQMEAQRDEHTAEVHRRWSPCDVKIIEAWISGRYPYAGESWDVFRERVAACLPPDGTEARDANIAIFTSATPTAVWAARALDIYDGRVMRLAGVLWNSSYTVLRLRGEQLRLFTFNAAPHLLGPELRTHR